MKLMAKKKLDFFECARFSAISGCESTQMLTKETSAISMIQRRTAAVALHCISHQLTAGVHFSLFRD